MVFNLTHEEVLKVCGTCENFLKGLESCRRESETKTLKEVHRCKKWDEFYGSTCLYR